MKRLVCLMVLVAALCVGLGFAEEHTMITQVRGYLALNGLDPGLVNMQLSPVQVIINKKTQKMEKLFFDSWRLKGVEPPTAWNLPDLETAEAAIAEYEASAAAAELVAQQAKKPAKLKGHELKVRTFLRSEGVISTNENFPTSGQLEAMFAAWDELPGNQGDAKASKYERLMRPVRLLGGDDLGGYGGD